ncbi:MAG: 1-acyl-sn-glycerol-3-phosphate acyltransferase [Polyangiaceae bacterium]
MSGETESAPIFGFNAARDEIVAEVVDRVVKGTEDPLYVLNDAAYFEIKRLEVSKRKTDQERHAEWQRLARGLGRMSKGERAERLRELVTEYAKDVAGNFNPRVYQLSTRILPGLVTALLAPRTLANLIRDPKALVSLDALEDKVLVEGPLERIRNAVKRGVAVFVPTHLSNMDSIVFGYALERAGLPPATYGAGKNLFTNPVLSYFMHNLGAYRVDRRLRHALYKDVLKTYSSVLLERGYHSLFFPGGTRSRSGGIERRLKLGLVGSALEAYARTVRAGRERRVYFVPATINYLITLEAETLIADYLSETGKNRYIIEDDESSRVGRMTSFVRKLLGMESSVVVRFGSPIDPFGNDVDDAGDSYDRRGRKVEPASYVKNQAGEVTLDPARDAQYTRELGEVICRSYERNTVIMSTHVVAAAALARLRKASPRPDLFTVLRQRDGLVIPRDELAADVRQLKEQLIEQEKRGDVTLGAYVRGASGGDLLERALRAFAGYHSSPVLIPRRDGIGIGDTKLLLYYQNRLASHGLAWDVLGGGARPGAVHAASPTLSGARGAE